MKIEKISLSWRKPLTPIKKVDTIVAHHPAHKSCGFQELHESHLAKGWNGIGYNYFVTFEGKVIEGRGKHIGAHCENHNSHSLGVCFQDNFEIQKMMDNQVEAEGWLIAQLIREYDLSINDIIEHKKKPGASTLCPGRNFRMADLKQSVLEWTNPSIKKEVAA